MQKYYLDEYKFLSHNKFFETLAVSLQVEKICIL